MTREQMFELWIIAGNSSSLLQPSGVLTVSSRFGSIAISTQYRYVYFVKDEDVLHFNDAQSRQDSVLTLNTNGAKWQVHFVFNLFIYIKNLDMYMSHSLITFIIQTRCEVQSIKVFQS